MSFFYANQSERIAWLSKSFKKLRVKRVWKMISSLGTFNVFVSRVFADRKR